MVSHNHTAMPNTPAHIYVTASLLMIDGVDFDTRKPSG